MEIVAQNQPSLDAPGAGLPVVELFLARILFGRFRKRNTPDTIDETIRREREAILDLVGPLEEAAGRTPVLINRIRGMEDSSRNWSVFMTLEHLRIVNESVSRTMKALSRCEVPSQRASTADVKPSVGAGAEAIEGFRASCDGLISSFGEITDSKRRETFDHPWFGPLGIRDWHAMAAFHLSLHRRQIESILKKLNS